ncbi:MAG TPA: tetratricopeptide repeat protein [Thermodesulfovibrionales bacterium]|nr:tetratricopeptide repeat protein [Thermodesulfovibrionales bacterium]
MSKLGVFLFIVFLGVLALFAIFNQNITLVKVPFGQTYETPTIALMLISIAAGAFAMLFVFVIRDTKRYVDSYQYQKKQKKDAKVQDLYSKALNYVFAHHNKTQAREMLNEILKEDPEHLNALLQLGDIAASEDDFQKAREYYQQARDVSPRNIDVLFSLEGLMEKTGRFADALRYIEEILDIDDENLTALYKKRDIFEKQEKWDDLVLVQKAILKNEHTEKDKVRERQNLVGYKYEYGRDSLENGGLEKAKKAFRTVLRLEKDFVPANLGLAEVLLQEGEAEEAINLLEKLYERTSSMIVLLRLEDMLISVGEPLRLIRIYKNKISRNTQDPGIKFFLGRLYYRLEMIDDAFETMASVDTAGTGNPAIHQLMGNLYMKRNQVDRAVHEFKRALESHECAFNLTYLCEQCGHVSPEWSGRCADCRKWSTYRLNLLT